MKGDSASNAIAAALAPKSIAIIGASDNPNKVGGRPVDYLKRFGFQGPIYPINPARESVQGVRCYPDLASLPEAPDLAIVALAGEGVAGAIRACTVKGVRAAIVLSSGFGETGEKGKQEQAEIAAEAARAGMRIVGPNSQGLANFSNGAVANFSTMFTQLPHQDGPIAIVSQSGATSAALYTLLRERGLGVRYVLATGNEADVTASELALETARDPAIKLIVLYTESIQDPEVLASAAALARERGIPIVALKAGRTASGAAAAASHTGALVNADGVVDAFFKRHGIWRANDFEGIVHAAELYLKDNLRLGRNLVVISNSGSSCVMLADAADALGLPLAKLSDRTKEKLREALASFAAVENPIDLTAAILGNKEVFGRVLRAIAEDPAGDLFLISLPVAGAGYDLERLADDTLAFEKQTGKTVVVVATLSSVLGPFRARGLATFTSERQAMLALDQITRHALLIQTRHSATGTAISVSLSAGDAPFLDEAESLALLSKSGVPVVAHKLCRNADEAVAAWKQMASPVVVKACSEGLPHKSEYGLVFLNKNSEDDVRAAFEACRKGMEALKVAGSGVIVAKMEKGRREMAIGGKIDPVFGPVIMVSDGGKYIEAMPDFCLLVPPFDAAEVKAELKGLRIAPLFAGVRGEPPMDLDALCDAVVGVASVMSGAKGAIASIDLNPVMVRSQDEGVVVVDALIERGDRARFQRS
ncbi:MAG TPA: acetate--CoA ligase family protein [Burkholderiales bacterium]|nr:acetate--CoA ligase family protein [Burkholderiales bacterium]